MIPVWNYSDLIKENPDGYWSFKATTKSISYTEDGHKISAAREQNSFWYNHRNQIIAYHIGLSSPGWILDVGGGTGYVSMHLQNRGIKTVLVEPLADGSRIARERGVRPIINATLSQIQFKDQSVPAIGLFDVLEHIEDEDELLRECHRILEPNGVLIITVPALNFLWSKFDKHVGHFRRYNKKSIKKLMEKNGFTPVYSAYFFFLLTLPIFVLRKIFIKFNYHADSSHTLKFNFMNVLIRKLLILEFRFSKNFSLPFGSSLIIKLKKT